MPRTRTLPPGEVTLLKGFFPDFIIETVKKAHQKKQKVEMLQSSFTDPGGDFNSILIDDQIIHTSQGY